MKEGEAGGEITNVRLGRGRRRRWLSGAGLMEGGSRAGGGKGGRGGAWWLWGCFTFLSRRGFNSGGFSPPTFFLQLPSTLLPPRPRPLLPPPSPLPCPLFFLSFFFSIFAVLHFSDYKKIQSPPVEWCSHRAIFNVPIENIKTFVNTQLIRSIGKIQTLVGSPDKNMIKRINGINQTGGNLDSVFSMNLMARCRL